MPRCSIPAARSAEIAYDPLAVVVQVRDAVLAGEARRSAAKRRLTTAPVGRKHGPARSVKGQAGLLSTLGAHYPQLHPTSVGLGLVDCRPQEKDHGSVRDHPTAWDDPSVVRARSI